MISIKEMAALEDASELAGASKVELMERAGHGVYSFLKNKLKLKGKKILVFCGSGNNAGDGFVAARHLSKVCDVSVLFLGEFRKLKYEGKINYKKIKENKKINIIKDIGKIKANKKTILIDAMLGTGTSGKLREPYASAVRKFNKLQGYKVAVDCPSGGKVKADACLTFHDKKKGLDYSGCKKVKIIDIGIKKMPYTSANDLKKAIKKRKKAAKKGDSGKVLVIGGSREYVGAAALAGLAALRSGADWVTIAAPEKAGWAINCLSADLIVKKFKGDYFSAKHANKILKMSEKFDCVLVGPGIGLKSKGFCKKFLKQIRKPCVADADAIKAIRLQDVDNCVLTPHSKELEILLKNSGIKKGQIQKHLKNNIILLKGHIDKIISKNKIKYNKTGNPRMAVAGTGDVLAGLCAGLAAQSGKLFESACAAAYLNGRIGEAQKGNFIASDMVDDINEIRKRTAKAR